MYELHHRCTRYAEFLAQQICCELMHYLQAEAETAVLLMFFEQLRGDQRGEFTSYRARSAASTRA